MQLTKDSNDNTSFSEGGNYFEDEPVCFQNNILHEVKLLKFLNDFSAPLYAYSSIMKWAHDANILKYNFQTNNKTYHQVIEKLEKVLSMQAFRPTTIKILLKGDNMEMDVVVFDVPTLLASLFNDTQLNQCENLVINPKDRFGKFVLWDNRLGEVNSGQWCETSYKNMVTDPDNNFLCPIILASDKTTLSDMGDLHVNVIFMTTSIFNTQVRLFDFTTK